MIDQEAILNALRQVVFSLAFVGAIGGGLLVALIGYSTGLAVAIALLAFAATGGVTMIGLFILGVVLHGFGTLEEGQWTANG